MNRLKFIAITTCLSIVAMCGVVGCTSVQESTSNDVSSGATDVSEQTASDSVTNLVGVWELAGYELDNEALEKVYPVEKLANEARWTIEDNIDLFMLGGSYIEFNEDGTYANYAGELDKDAKVFNLEKTLDGTWVANDDGTYTMTSDKASATVTLDDDGFCAVKPNSEDATYSTLYRHETKKISDIEPAPMPKGVVYSARANVCKEVSASAVSNVVVNDNGTEDEADDTISLDVDTSKITDTWFDNKPYVVIEKCDNYPYGIAVEVESIERDGDIWHVKGVTPDVGGFILMMNVSS